MEEDVPSPLVLDGTVCDINLSLATTKEICTSCANDVSITHPSQLTNPFLGLPLESGKCEACGTAEHGQCEGVGGEHLTYALVDLVINFDKKGRQMCWKPMGSGEDSFLHMFLPLIDSFYCGFLKRNKNTSICLALAHLVDEEHARALYLSTLAYTPKCAMQISDKKKDKRRIQGKTSSSSSCMYCKDLPPISVVEMKSKTIDGAIGLELKASSRARFRDGFWNFLEKYGSRYGDSYCRPLLPSEALNILKKIPEETQKKLASKGYYPQSGFIMQCLPVPPNCLYSPDYTDGKSIMSSDISLSMLRRVLNKVELIKRSRSGSPNFESHEVESNDLQAAISLYMHLRGTPKAPHDVMRKYVRVEPTEVSTKQWLEKMRTLFIRKSSGFSSRSVITGDMYKGVNEIGLPLEIATKITIEERVTVHNMRRLQQIVDDRQCVTYKDGSFTYAITVGSKGHTFLKVGQVVHRRIMDGDVVFLNRPPSTHKHSLQAFSVYVHDDRTVKINPLICAPLGADFDGDCIHLFYPQSLAARAEALELFNVEQQLLSSHNGALNLQLVQDSLLALKLMQRTCFLKKTTAQQLGMFVCSTLPPPALCRVFNAGPFWTVTQILQSSLPHLLDCCGEKYLIMQGEIMFLDFERDNLQSTLTEIATSILFLKGQKEAVMFFNLLQPLLMEFLFLEGFSISLMDFNIPKDGIDNVRRSIKDSLQPLCQSRETYNELIDSQVENNLKRVKSPVVDFILKCSSLGSLIDAKSDSTISKVVQQLGFLGLQLSDRGKLYSPALVKDIFSHLKKKYPAEVADCPTKAYGLIGSSFFHGLDPYEVLVHSVSTREVIIRSSGGLTEPGTLFKNLMSILRDVVVCYDGTVRNVCTNSIILFEYGADDCNSTMNHLPAGEPVGVLAATAISNPAYKAVLDSSQSTNSSWELMKEALLSKVNFKNDAAGRRVVLYMNDCFCGKRFCKERAACVVRSCLKKVMLRNCAVHFSIEYQKQIFLRETSETVHGLMGHIHLSQSQLVELNCKVDEICQKCLDVIRSYGKKRSNVSQLFRKISLFPCECCSWNPHKPCHQVSQSPCLHFVYHDRNADTCTEDMETTIDIMVNTIYPILLDTVIKGDPRVHSTKIIWIGPDTIPRVRNLSKVTKGEVAVEVVIDKDVVKQNGDAWRVALDSCLPVMHLIDTRRSIPYGIQQIRDCLGISSAFDQSIQRLSTAVRSVSKGVLKQHLMLVVHSMTFSGNVIGFYTSGFKALFRSLKVQVPFTEATLFTPLKCFERAADKCHKDALSSVVASCSWGKRVATGSGTHFQILWNKKQMPELEDVGKDAYGFLHLVRETSSERGKSSPYLGVDVDNFAEVGNADLNLSPEHNLDFVKLTFDEGPEAPCNFENGKLGNSCWESVVPSTDQSDSWQQWGNEKLKSKNQNDMPATSAGKSDGWHQWENEKHLEFGNQNDVPVALSGKSDSWEQWGNEKQLRSNNPIDMPATPAGKSDGWQQWNNEKQLESCNQNGMPATPAGKSDGWQEWGNAKQPEANIHGDMPAASGVESDSRQGWGRDKQHDVSNRNVPTASAAKSDIWNRQRRNEKQNNAGNYNDKSAASTFESHNLPGRRNEKQHYASNDIGTPKDDVGCSWVADRAQNQDKQSRKPSKDFDGFSSWNNVQSSTKPSDQSNAGGNWNLNDVDAGGDQAAMSNDGICWNRNVKTPHLDGQRSPVWGSTNSKHANQNELALSFSKPEFQESQNSDVMWTKLSVNDTSVKKSNERDWSKNETQGEWGSSQKCNTSSHAWGTNSNLNMESTGVNSDHVPSSKSDVLAFQDSNETSSRKLSNSSGWNDRSQNHRDRPMKSDGWGSWNAGDRRVNRNHSDGKKGRDAVRGMTPTGRRLDFFNCEEEKILVDVEPIMQSIKRILHQSSYFDGDRLSADDQSYILNNVFQYHPDRNAKVGGEVDYVMVDKHKSFQDSRCFFVVSTDGSSSDFSYIKCMENFIKQNYPDNAESFNLKYFRKRRADAQNDSELQQ